MPKVTVENILTTAKTLQRFENYTHRNMDKTQIVSANEAVQGAIDILQQANKDFLDSDVRDFELDVSRETTRLKNRENQLQSVKNDIKDYKAKIKNPPVGDIFFNIDDVISELAWSKSMKKDLKVQIKELKEVLA